MKVQSDKSAGSLGEHGAVYFVIAWAESIDSNVRGHARPSDQKKGQLFVFRLSRDKIKIFGPSSGENNRVSREDVEPLWFYVFVGWQNFVMTVELKSGIRGHSADSFRIKIFRSLRSLSIAS